ncbi:MAG: TetR family transcriptional regulator [Mesorhizobium sp.]|uniref:TetR family transcriptional regulator C-terminal domain-containing protein n=2 Tax=Mesorhizobium sp. TaxID=1871066 RepID=UPI000FE8BA00|nr:MAG: TetR family transcriptional regulator [Mesorhizobium sp.]RWC50486.1 MAG: TetR family transcriptional regulator [Mesorhizobium sp.]RWC62385.1 MAG: TetR family transcriptional regulator [Mesorhizobium sp.]RWC65691.1 MAG: TetR family transcriptional regulator [Mesorhizobium sp.]TIX28368.1 MAG: TetR family transcriptional regulator [Mesorhizobium sp.]
MAKKNMEHMPQNSPRQQQLLDAALNVVARRGLSGITVNDIADEAGCSYGVIAFHFKTKERLLLAVLDLLASNYEKIWLDAMTSASASPAERLRVLVDVDFDPRVAKSKHLAVWMAFWAEASRVPAYKKRCSELKHRSLETIVTLVAALAAERKLSIDANAVARGLYSITDGCWVFSHVTGENSPQMRERSRQVCLTFLGAFFPDDFGKPEQAAPVRA